MGSESAGDVATRPPESVTVTVTRRALAGREQERAAWVQAGRRLTAGFDGFLGAGHVRPRPTSPDRHMLYRFADEPALARWQSTSQREWWLEGRRAPRRRRPPMDGGDRRQ